MASPLIAPLVLLGWGASVGGLAGASIGAAENRQIVLVVETRTAAEKTIARKLIKDLIGDYKDIDTA